jgi:hypothetical protein
MNKSKLKDLVREVTSEINTSHNKPTIYESAQKDIRYFESKLVSEGLWSSIKQTVGGAIDKMKGKAKEAIVQPIVNALIKKLAKNDPKGFVAVKNAAEAGKIGDLLNNPAVKREAEKVKGVLSEINESLYEGNLDDLIKEYNEEVFNEVKKSKAKTTAKKAKRKKLYVKTKEKAKKLLVKNKMVVKDKETGEPRKATKKDYEAIIRALIEKERNDPNTPPEEKKDYEAILTALIDQARREKTKPEDKPNLPHLEPAVRKIIGPTGGPHPDYTRVVVPSPKKEPEEPTGFFAKVLKWINNNPTMSSMVIAGILSAIFSMIGASSETANSMVKISTSEQFKVGGDLVIPGEQLTQRQLGAMKMAMDMGNDGYKLYGPEMMRKFHAQMK